MDLKWKSNSGLKIGLILINIELLYYIKKKGGIKIPPFNLKI
jgi:hypothetical protein